MGAIFAPTRFSLVRISVRDLAADGKSLVRSSGVGGGGQNRILKFRDNLSQILKEFRGSYLKFEEFQNLRVL